MSMYSMAAPTERKQRANSPGEAAGHGPGTAMRSRNAHICMCITREEDARARAGNTGDKHERERSSGERRKNAEDSIARASNYARYAAKQTYEAITRG